MNPIIPGSICSEANDDVGEVKAEQGINYSICDSRGKGWYVWFNGLRMTGVSLGKRGSRDSKEQM
jgi:hypothetical protein